MELSKVVLLIRDFLSPVNKLDQIGLNEISISTILLNIIENFSSKNPDFEIELETDEFWRFGLIGLKLIKLLNEAEFEINKNNCYLSINDERLVSTLCQLITCFCIHYNLEDNVGISIEKLSKYGINITKKRALINPIEKNNRLIITFNYLNEIKLNKREHIDLIRVNFYRKYIHEIICSLAQIVYSPNSNLSEAEKKVFKNWLEEDLFEESDGANLVSNLIMAQGTGRVKGSNEWFLIIIGKLLTKCLLRPNSVMNVIRAVLTEMNAVSTVSVASDWKKCDIVAKILAQCPKEVSIEDYIKFISPQIINLFFAYDPKFSKHFNRVSGSIYSQFSQRWPKLTFEYLTKPILESFLPDSNQQLKITFQQFKNILNKIHLIFVSSTEPNWNTLNQLPINLVVLLFKLYVCFNKKIDAVQTKNMTEDVLKLYIRLNPDSLRILKILLKESLLNENSIEINFENFKDDLDKNEEDLILIQSIIQQDTITIETVEKYSKTLTSLIKSLNDNQLKINFMIDLLFEINNTSKISNLNANSKNDQTLIEIENKVLNESNDINLKIIYFTQLSHLFEDIDPELIVKNHEKIIEFCKLILESYLKLDLNSNEHNTEMIHVILSIISVFTTGVIELEYEIKQKLQILLPILNELKLIFSGKDLEQMIDSLYISIATYIGIKTEQKILIEEVYSQDEYGQALRDSHDPLIPVKAHGLVQLRKLIESKNQKCLENKSNLIELGIKNLKNEDSYVYLASIQLLISLVDLNPETILDLLVKEYISTEKKLDIENRLKIGEVLTKTVRNFNELVPKYGLKLINTFLIGTKNKDEMIRSSSLSNLGETCKLLNFCLSDNIYEVMNCLSSLLDTDSSIQVKRSASLVLKMIVEGLNKDSFIQVLGKSISDLYKLLIKIKTTANDDVVKLNCQLTSDYINELMKHSMFPKQKLEKEIKVLRA